MRTPNCNCVICNKPLYRRPNELKSVKLVCCKKCRSEAYKKYPSKNSLNNLKLGHEEGNNHLKGIKRTEESKLRIKIIMKKWCKENQSLIEERAKKTREENHYNWKGGKSNLNQDIRSLHEMGKWQNKAQVS